MPIVTPEQDLGMLILLVILIKIGSRVTESRRGCRSLGGAIASLVFLVAWLGESDYERNVVGLLGAPGVPLLFAALIQGGIALGVSWIVLPTVAVVLEVFVQNPWKRARRSWSDLEKSANERRARMRRNRELRSQAREYERAAPERERQRQEAEVEAARRTAVERAKADAKAAVLLAFSQHAPVLGDRFPRATLDEFVTKYMSDSEPLEVIQRRGRELMEVMERQRKSIEPGEPTVDLDALGRWYADQLGKVESLMVDDDAKVILRGMLEDRFDDLIHKHFQENRP